MNLSDMSIEQKRELLTSVLSKGKFAHVKWVKKCKGDKLSKS